MKLSTLLLLDTLIRNYHSRLPPGALQPVLAELPALITDADLHIAQLTMNLMTSVARLAPDPALRQLSAAGLPEVLRLARSPLLQGAALQSMLELFRALVGSGSAADANLTARALNESLAAPVVDAQTGASVHKQGRASTAKCVAAVMASSPAEAKQAVSRWCGAIQTKPCLPHQQTFFLLAIGEIGKIQ